jgi:hypothetical protein
VSRAAAKVSKCSCCWSPASSLSRRVGYSGSGSAVRLDFGLRTQHYPPNCLALRLRDSPSAWQALHGFVLLLGRSALWHCPSCIGPSKVGNGKQGQASGGSVTWPPARASISSCRPLSPTAIRRSPAHVRGSCETMQFFMLCVCAGVPQLLAERKCPRAWHGYPTLRPSCRPNSQDTPLPRTTAITVCPSRCSITGFHGTRLNPMPSSIMAKRPLVNRIFRR